MLRRNFDCAGEQNYHSCLGVVLLRSFQSVPPNFAASLGARKRSAVKTFSKKERRYPYLSDVLHELVNGDVQADLL